MRLIVAGLALSTGSGSASDLQDPASSAMIAYRAFECARLASSQMDHPQETRLFELGLSEARKAAEALIRGDLSEQELTQREVMTTFYMEGPTPDFIAGRMYEGAGNGIVVEAKAAAGGNDASFADTRRALSRMYQDENCELLGIGR